ncbi:17895_t:CDS:10 [Funneliformis geosporum]|nr:17895_t:CDS:10 [Funneliformis geosporum]
MHGRRRVKPSAEVEKLRKEKEATKIKEYNNLVTSCFEKRDKNEFDNDAFTITTKILSQNPDFYTIWNFRRSVLLYGILKECSEKDNQQTLSTELGFLQELFKLNPKSYWIFNHRRWCLEKIPNPDWNMELKLVGKFLEMDARNCKHFRIHAWDYRRYVTSQLSSTIKTSLTQTEFDFTTTKINQNFSNYSAWHQRSKLLPRLIKEQNLDEQDKKNLVNKEFELVKAAFYTDPDDQSAWLYHWWLVGREIQHISLLGAYYNPKMRQVVLAFDDEIGMVIPFQVTKKINDKSPSSYIEGMWRPAGGELKHDQLNIDRSYGFVWIFTFFDSVKDDFTELIVTVKPEFIVPSHSEIKLTRTIQRHCIINDDYNLENDTLPIDASERIKLLQREISMVRELLELEPDSKSNLLRELKYISGTNMEETSKIDYEVVTICDHLIKIDKLRTKRFEDLRSKAIFESATKSLIKLVSKELAYSDDIEQYQNSTFSLESKNLTIIPTPSILLYITKLNLSNNKLTSIKFLANLIDLKEIDVSNNCITDISGVSKLRNLKDLKIQNNYIKNWEEVKNGFIGWQGVECNIYIFGNPLIVNNNEVENLKIGWEDEIKEYGDQLKIIWK